MSSHRSQQAWKGATSFKKEEGLYKGALDNATFVESKIKPQVNESISEGGGIFQSVKNGIKNNPQEVQMGLNAAAVGLAGAGLAMGVYFHNYGVPFATKVNNDISNQQTNINQQNANSFQTIAEAQAKAITNEANAKAYLMRAQANAICLEALSEFNLKSAQADEIRSKIPKPKIT